MRSAFRDRVDAGKELGRTLSNLGAERPVVVGLARGGVVLAYEIANALGAELDVLVVRKVGAPFHREFGIGAVGPGGVQVVDTVSLEAMGLSREIFDELADEERNEVERRLRAFHGDRDPIDLRGRTVILVDDGLATGVTALAAIRSVQRQHPRKVILAVPVCAYSAYRLLQAQVDQIICLHQPKDFRAVGQWYDDFDQVPDETVQLLLKGVKR